jgi:transcriptional regulator with XRE-family HTH domain
LTGSLAPKAAGLSQVQLARALDIPQRTLSFYEREGTYIPSTLLPGIAKALGVTIEEVLGISESQARKRGPKSRLERQLESIGKLPRNQQQKILAVVEAFIAQHAEP